MILSGLVPFSSKRTKTGSQKSRKVKPIKAGQRRQADTFVFCHPLLLVYFSPLTSPRHPIVFLIIIRQAGRFVFCHPSSCLLLASRLVIAIVFHRIPYYSSNSTTRQINHKYKYKSTTFTIHNHNDNI